MFEVEAKVVLMAPGALRDRLRRADATPHEPVVQTDHYLLHPCRDVAARDEAVRVREERRGGADDGAGGDEEVRWHVTHKGPRLPGDAQTREEHEVGVDADPRPLLAALGFAPAATVRKRREPWRFGALWVVLDEVDGLGWFAEVEAVAEGPDGVAAAGGRVEEALRDLGLGGAERVAASYLELLGLSG